MTYQRAFNGLDMGWALDTGDGNITTNTVTTRKYVYNPGFVDYELVLADVALANYQAIHTANRR